MVGVQNRLALKVARRAADGLDQRSVGTQKTFLVGIQNGHQRHLRQIQAFAQQVDAHQDIKQTQPQVANNLGTLDGVYIRMHVANLDPVFMQVVGQILRHSFGQHGNQYAFLLFRAQTNLAEHIVDLASCRPHFHLRVNQPGRPDNLLNHAAPGLLGLVRSWRG